MNQGKWDKKFRKVSNINTLRKMRNLIKKRKTQVVKNPPKLLGSQMSSQYRKVDWNKPYLECNQAKNAVKGPFLKCWRRLIADGQMKSFRFSKELNKVHYKTNNIQGLCLIRQIAALQQAKYFRPPSKRKKKVQKYPFIYDSAYIGQVQLFWYPKSKQWKLPLIKQWLNKRQYLFDQQNPFYKGFEKTKTFVKNCLFDGRVEKWDYYLQRFLSQGNK